MSNGLRIGLFMIAVMAAIPLGLFMFNTAGWSGSMGSDTTALAAWSFPNLAQYASPTNTPIDVIIGMATIGLTALTWLFTIFFKVVFIYPMLVELFGMPVALATALTPLLVIAEIIGLYILIRGQTYI